MDTTDQKNSICHVQPIQMYQLPTNNMTIKMPFNLLNGEACCHYGKSNDGIIILTNYRLYLQINNNTNNNIDNNMDNNSYHYHIPLGLIEIVEHRELFYLHICCKDARTYRCTFENNESCLEWYDRISKAAEPPKQLEQLFAFYHFIWSKDANNIIKNKCDNKIQMKRNYTFNQRLFEKERERLKFEGDSWRISEININYKLCPTYPQYLIVPSCISDDKLEAVAKFRSSRRIPAIVWRHRRNGSIIARCSQPEVGWLGWRSSEDEDLIKSITDACNFDLCYIKTSNNAITTTELNNLIVTPSTSTNYITNNNNNNNQLCDNQSDLSTSPNSLISECEFNNITLGTDLNNMKEDIKEKKILIMDARSYTTAVANRARGGGCECPEYYPNCEIQFMNLANIHSIRKSFHSLRVLCMSSADQPNWYSQLENTRWLQHMSGLMKAAVTLVNAVEREARPVLVHCSDGWDRTPQIVALAELLLDPYYRTLDGFRILIEREWLAFGHKFADRCGHSSGSDDQNERCPVFLQWLDCVHQLLLQFTCAFEFSQSYLVKLAQHVYSNLYGTFLCNTFQERMKIVNDKTFSVWEFLNNSPQFKNHLFTPIKQQQTTDDVLWPQCNVRDLQLWNDVYLGKWEMSNFIQFNTTTTINYIDKQQQQQQQQQFMTKTKSYGDLINDCLTGNGFTRHCSDPNLNIDNKLASGDFLTNEEDENDVLINNDKTECNNDCIYKNDNNKLNNETETKEELLNLLMDDVYVNENEENKSKQLNCLLKTYENDVLIEKTDDNNIIINNDDNDTSENEDVTENTIISTDNLVKSNIVNNDNNDDDDNSIINNLSNGNNFNKINNLKKNMETSNHTSTDTLISENLFSSSSPKEINGFEKLQSPLENNIDNNDTIDGFCDDINLFIDNTNSILQNNTIKPMSRASTPPLILNTTTTTTITTHTDNCFTDDYDNSCCSSSNNNDILQQQRLQQQQRQQQVQQQYCLGDDGLIPIRSMAQERLWQIIQENKRKEDALEKELHILREKYIKNVCHKCSHNSNNNNEKMDDAVSIVETVSSTGEGQVSVVESSRSDMSWEALEDGSTLYPEIHGTLWVPDHAVNKCTGCQIEFWVGKRKHHCRKCGRIFCADCSRNSTPLPSEQLYNPVRVCTGCFMKLRRDCINNDVLQTSSTTMSTTLTLNHSLCNKNDGRQQQKNNNTQIRASSN